VATESEIGAIVNEIRDRVQARHPQGEAQGIGTALPDLLPILHARDAAAAKVAAIGTVNPRPPGIVNDLVQSLKRSIARALGWFVRDQVEYNRGVLVALEATLEALNDVNRTFVAVGARLDEIKAERAALEERAEALIGEARELKDIRSHWVHWRDEWEKKLFQTEVHFLRGLGDMQGAIDTKLHRADANYRESMRLQHVEFTAAIARTVEDVHARFWSDMEKVRLEYERTIHEELRVVRQKAFASAATGSSHAVAGSHPQPALDFDYARFAERFRGSFDDIVGRQRRYLPLFQDRSRVLDVGCGRGEFLELMREAGVTARGIDLDPESVALCRGRGLDVETGDVFDVLAATPAGFYDGIFAAQVIEHMTPSEVPAFVKLCGDKLRSGGVLVLETPNPESLAIFATHFYLDPTHQRPVPPSLLVFYFEEYGFGAIDVQRLSPAVESFPELQALPDALRERFFGGLDYAVAGRKL
jgi:2-polyprenyl-3-methyl-5-hydroxy-6-metoxy-1,4-benzoquinol methylase